MAQAQFVGTRIFGLQAVLQELKYLDRTLYKEIEKQIAAPLKAKIAEPVGLEFPDSPPLSRWVASKGTGKDKLKHGKRSEGASRFPYYDPERARKGVKVVVGGRKKVDVLSGQTTYPIARIKQGDGAGVVFDMAGAKDAASQFVQNLTGAGFKNPSRVMWDGVEKRYPLIQREIETILQYAEDEVSGRLSARGGLSEYQAASARASSQPRNPTTGRFGA
jgi:hypothetical protein